WVSLTASPAVRWRSAQCARETQPVHEAPPSSCIRLADLTPEIVNERCETGVIRGNACQLLRVIQCGGEISGIAAEAHKRQQGIAIAGMAGQARHESRHGSVDIPGRMRSDGINIRISCPLGIEFGGTAQFLQRLLVPLEPSEREAKRV